MKQISTAALRQQTITYWASFSHARAQVDVARVHAFQTMLRENPDTSTVTDAQVTEAYGGRGWAPVPVCIECGAREDSNVLFGPDPGVPVCRACISAASALNAAPAPKKSFFSRLIGN